MAAGRQVEQRIKTGGTKERERNEKLYHLMDGLLYPAVVGTGLVVLLMRAAVSRAEDEFWGRMALGLMTLAIYCSSYVAFKDVEEAEYKARIFIWDAAEVVLIFGCFLAMGLLDPRDPEPIHFLWFLVLISIDLLVVQPLWRGFAFKDKQREGSFFQRYKDTALHLYGVRLLLVVFIGIGGFFSDPKHQIPEVVASIVGIGLVLSYEFWWRKH